MFYIFNLTYESKKTTLLFLEEGANNCPVLIVVGIVNSTNISWVTKLCLIKLLGSFAEEIDNDNNIFVESLDKVDQLIVYSAYVKVVCAVIVKFSFNQFKLLKFFKKSFLVIPFFAAIEGFAPSIFVKLLVTFFTWLYKST